VAITIRHLDGPLAGQLQRFDDSVDRIVFGRDPACQVVYPPVYTLVGRKHFELRQTRMGEYVIELLAERYVEIDGMEADNGMPVTSGSVIRLGRRDGPSFEVDIQDEIAEIAWTAEKVDLPDDLVASLSEGPEESLVDLLVKRESEVPAVVAGITADVVHHLEPGRSFPPPSSAQSPSPVRVGAADRPRSTFDPWFEDLLQGGKQSLPKGVGSGGAPNSRPAESPRLQRHSDAPPSRPARPEVYADYAPRAEMRMRRSTGLFWWVAIALGAAVAGYLLYRREAALGAVLGKLLYAAAPPPPATKEIGADLVDMSVFGPTAIEAGGEGLIQVFLHTLSQREIAKALAQETDHDTARRGVQTLAAEIARGQRVEIILEGRGLSVGGEMQTVVWRGEPCACQFTVSVAANSTGRTFHPRVLVLVDSVPVGSLTFALKVTAEAASKTEPELRGDRARRYHYAFLSYASPDRAEVFKRAQGLKAGGTSFFNDLLSLDPGERWEKRLYQEIDRCDVFYLFWSSQAKESEWVMKETEYALARRMASANGDPDIVPVIIEGPPPPSPPESLKDIHFNDSLLYVLAGVGGGRSVSGN